MDTRTENQEHDLEALRAEVERLQAEQRRFREEVDRELVRRAFKISELERSLHQNTSLEYQASLSWRITKPLRLLKGLLRRG